VDILIFILILTALSLFLWRQNKQRQAKVNPYEQESIKKFREDTKKARWLIRTEHKTNPKISTKKAARNAFQSLRQDQQQ
jgi:hypothetical protein